MLLGTLHPPKSHRGGLIIRVAFVTGTFTALVGLLIISIAARAQHVVAQNPAPQRLEQEIKRVEAEIDRILARRVTLIHRTILLSNTTRAGETSMEVTFGIFEQPGTRY